MGEEILPYVGKRLPTVCYGELKSAPALELDML
jgi:hypothetical protein